MEQEVSSFGDHRLDWAGRFLTSDIFLMKLPFHGGWHLE